MNHEEALVRAEELLTEADALCTLHGISMAAVLAKSNAHGALWLVDGAAAGPGFARIVTAIRELNAGGSTPK